MSRSPQLNDDSSLRASWMHTSSHTEMKMDLSAYSFGIPFISSCKESQSASSFHFWMISLTPHSSLNLVVLLVVLGADSQSISAAVCPS